MPYRLPKLQVKIHYSFWYIYIYKYICLSLPLSLPPSLRPSLSLTPCKTEQLLQDMELQEKEAQKD